jgi:hypothetical protein
MSIEAWKSIFDWATVVLIAFTVFSGAGALITGNIIGKRQEAIQMKFEKELADAKKALGSQEERVETLRGDNLRLQALIQPRELTPDQQRDIGKELLPFEDRPVSIAAASMNDPESYHFAEQICAALKYAKLSVVLSPPVSPNGRQYTGVTETGVRIVWFPPEQQDFGMKLAHALSDIGHVRNLLFPPDAGHFVDGSQPVTITVLPKPFDLLK